MQVPNRRSNLTLSSAVAFLGSFKNNNAYFLYSALKKMNVKWQKFQWESRTYKDILNTWHRTNTQKRFHNPTICITWKRFQSKKQIENENLEIATFPRSLETMQNAKQYELIKDQYLPSHFFAFPKISTQRYYENAVATFIMMNNDAIKSLIGNNKIKGIRNA